jgi:hypothetical protein
MQLCIDRLIESNDRLYRMLDTAIYGRQYTIAALEPLTVNPVINPTRALVYEDNASILGRLHSLLQVLDNGLNGTETQQFNRADGIRDLLEQIIAQLQESGNLDPEILAKLTEIAALVA